jgi:hypothetical protein
MSSEISEDSDDFDDLIFTPKSTLVPSILNPPTSDRQLSLIPPTNENFTIDSPSEGSDEPLLASN